MEKSKLRQIIREEIHKLNEITLKSSDFDIPKFELLDVAKESDGYDVTYNVNVKKVHGTQDFEKCKAVRKYGYEPVDVGRTKDNKTSVFFEKY